MKIERVKADLLIIGGGTAGCYAALTAAEHSGARIVIAEKADIKRSGCLAAGVNAINAYITKGHTPKDYVEYAKRDAAGIVREDLLLSIAKNVNRVTGRLEQLGLVILKDADGNYVARGSRNIKINGENIKVILSDAVKEHTDVKVLNHVNITDYLIGQGRILGAVGFHVDEEKAYVVRADAVICATGGAAGLYRPNNPGFSKHKIWYPPFNTGAGYAMGILAGAEMTTMEMRFIALRCKDTIAPTGTIAQGAGARQVNARGEIYEGRYGLTTSERVYGTARENAKGRGPCYLRTKGITKKQDEELLKAYLNMAPSQALKWIESGKNPSRQNVEIEGTEPYIVGGHTASGYWVDNRRQTTVKGLYAAGDVAGGAPQKYVSGALAEGEIAALSALEDLAKKRRSCSEEAAQVHAAEPERTVEKNLKKIIDGYEAHLGRKDPGQVNPILMQGCYHDSLYDTKQLEEAMQTVMDRYAGGIGSGYRYNEGQLNIAEEKILFLTALSSKLHAPDMDELLRIYELKERLVVCRVVIAHLKARRETRWRGFGENTDYPKQSSEWELYLNSKLVDGTVQIIYRDLVKGDEVYEHSD